MQLVVDSHTHTIASGHAYSTVQENAKEALVNGIAMFVMTDHGPAMKGAPYLYHFGNLKTIPRMINGVTIIRGAEANIIDYDGSVDIPDNYLHSLEYVIASFHDICIEPASIEEHTRALIKLIQNPLIDVIGHPGNPMYQVDIDQVVQAAVEYNKPIEINNKSFLVRTGSEANCLEFLKKCKQYHAPIVCGSDAHISFEIGLFDKLYRLFSKTEFPESLILNASTEKFESYLQKRRNRISGKT